MKRQAEVVQEARTLYRGTTKQYKSPTLNSFDKEVVSCHFVSCTKSREIAEEFAGKSGYVHTFLVQTGCLVYDLAQVYTSDDPIREQEVLVYPKHRFSLLHESGHNIVWSVTRYVE